MPGIDSYTKLLLHCDGANASTTFADASASAHTLTANGNAQVSTASPKFGTGAALFDGSGDYLSAADNADWNFGTGDFTLDCWVRRNGSQNYAGIISTSILAMRNWTLRIINGTVGFYADPDAELLSSSTTLDDLTWTHVALVRYVNTLTLYFNGTSVGTFDATGKTFAGGGQGLIIGRHYIDHDDYYFNGQLDEIRISKGIARWTAAFTPLTEAYSFPFTPSNIVRRCYPIDRIPSDVLVW